MIIKQKQLFRNTMPVRGHSSTGLIKCPSQTIHAYPLPCALLQSYQEDNSGSSCPWLFLGFLPARSLTKKHQVSCIGHKRGFRVCWRSLSSTAIVGPARARTCWTRELLQFPSHQHYTVCLGWGKVNPWAVPANFACKAGECQHMQTVHFEVQHTCPHTEKRSLSPSPKVPAMLSNSPLL